MDISDRIGDRDAELGRQLGPKVVTTVTVSDKPGVELVDIADRNGAAVIVMGTNTRPIFQRAFFRPYVEYVINNVPCPVAVLSSV
ncbi:universal stress protein [Natrinema sp. HArc-T2]|uniref:universal stress protein n=1 Tax=Natrinema sp. HArc-T2 TaxID=3242701 RepID=UPI00359E3512